MKLLIVEDEPSLNKSIVEFLTSQQYLCESVDNYQDAVDKISCYEYDCIVLDIMLPGGNGLLLLQLLKEQNKTDGVIIISARNELDDKIKGIQLGADDYLTKPFHLSELSVRIAAIIRRKSQFGNSLLTFHEIQLDTQAKSVSIKGQALVLTRKEYDLLLYFIVNKNRVLSKNTIAEHLWGDDMDLADNYDFIYTHIKNLRKKLLLFGARDYIQSVYGMGYKFTDQ
ncbi:response regulator transcription factor [Solitalea sp. MAHUQ-68]|uniref:Response regulator transcription factor n=1 Tax=Solitalea agri TaxID=2953739 RepID=A0A9X2F349_9SPHI|nr:response regulator transcription factor [Solitalea agri]MCO4293329.1 response regulator transcription factor [Solitalea agri]